MKDKLFGITDIKAEYKLKIDGEEFGIGITHLESQLNGLEDLFKSMGELAAEAFNRAVNNIPNKPITSIDLDK